MYVAATAVTLLSLTLLSDHRASAVTFTDCADVNVRVGRVTSIAVDGCTDPSDSVCRLPVGRNLTITAAFTSGESKCLHKRSNYRLVY